MDMRDFRKEHTWEGLEFPREAGSVDVVEYRTIAERDRQVDYQAEYDDDEADSLINWPADDE